MTGTALWWAVMSDSGEIVKLLIDKGATSTDYYHTGLPVVMTAIKENKPNAFAALMEKGANLNARSNTGDTALIEASKSGGTDSQVS